MTAVEGGDINPEEIARRLVSAHAAGPELFEQELRLAAERLFWDGPVLTGVLAELAATANAALSAVDDSQRNPRGTAMRQMFLWLAARQN